VKVLMTADTVGGVWPHTLELARALRRYDVSTVLAALGPSPTGDQERDARTVPDLVLHAAPFRLPWMDDPWSDVAAAGDWLLQLAADADVDLVHLSEPIFAALPWAAPVIAVGHSCVLSWFAAVQRRDAPAEWTRYRKAMQAGLQAANAVAAPSAAMLRELERFYGVVGGSVVPNGRDAACFAPGRKRPFVLTAGRLWDPAKNVGLLAAVAPGLPWAVYAAGESRSPDGGETRALGALTCVGPLAPPVMARALSHASIYALPARYEPFGQSVLEAALSGCALVLGDIPSLRELWHEAALFVSPDDPTPLRSTLERLIADAPLRDDLAARARRRALEYSPDRMARGYLTLYDRLRSPACVS
jgi:glycosyltransferase involved in cell wall biosynthesis